MKKDVLKNRFEYVCDMIINSERVMEGIGTLSEKTVHSVLKNFYEKDRSKHEVRVGKYVADIFKPNHEHSDIYNTDIVEIQTANFNKLRNKLEAFLPDYSVTVVYPIPHIKMLSWIDTDTGEISRPRRSPKVGNEFMAFKELYKIKMYLKNPNLHIHLVLVDIEEYRLLDGWSSDRKKGSTRNERLPTQLHDIVCIDDADDYIKMIPKMECDEFTFKEYMKAAKITDSAARTALNILTYMRTVERIGKKGNAIIYKVNEK